MSGSHLCVAHENWIWAAQCDGGPAQPFIDDDSHIQIWTVLTARIRTGTLLELARRLAEERRKDFARAETELASAIERARQARDDLTDATELLERACILRAST